MSDNNEALLLFAKTLAGHYSNLQQSQENPKDFAHINIFFRPLPWDVLKAPGFYSEQSYDHDPWRPYRQGIHRLLPAEGETFIVENYGFADPIRLAGAGQRPELLNSLKPESLKPRCGCGMAGSRIWSAKWMSTPQTGSVAIEALTPTRMSSAGAPNTGRCGSNVWLTSGTSWTRTGSSGEQPPRLSS
jgi:hypothetical protein